MSKEIQKTNPQRLTDMLKAPSVSDQFEQALGEARGTFVSSLISAYTTNPKLRECEPSLVVSEALKAAALRLPVEPSLGLAYIIPYKGTPSFQLGYKGLLQLAMRSGVYENINADAVYEGEITKKDRLTGTVELDGERISDKVVGFFAFCKTTNGFQKMVYMSREEVEAHAKKFSKTYSFSNSVWKTDFEAMAIKTVLKKLLSVYGQLSIEAQITLGQEDNPITREFSEDNTLEIPNETIDIEAEEVTQSDDPY